MIKIGVVQARFQIPHLKEMEYILAAKMRCERLFIGITYPDNQSLKLEELEEEEREEKKKEFQRNNPLTYYERYEMIMMALEEFGAAKDEFEIIPFPIDKPEYILQYAPEDATYFIAICDDEDQRYKRTLEGLGLNTEVLWRRTLKEKGVTGSEIREKIRDGKRWKQLVPKTTHTFMKKNKIDKRIKDLDLEEV
ncbi:nicotinate-nucleotide adenylyltransferase [Lachnospiraceae bacterium OttesenSCG-928-E19]|nr:nicotinate-nucleotide adenylyltransferase [Lachnospiraceae bacterium OttesenSCG-928-E19]